MTTINLTNWRINIMKNFFGPHGHINLPNVVESDGTTAIMAMIVLNKMKNRLDKEGEAGIENFRKFSEEVIQHMNYVGVDYHIETLAINPLSASLVMDRMALLIMGAYGCHVSPRKTALSVYSMLHTMSKKMLEQMAHDNLTVN